jgi:WD40 repeat protein
MTALASVDHTDVGAEVTSPLVSSAQLSLGANATACAFSHDGSVCAVALGDGTISLIEGFDEAAAGGDGSGLRATNLPLHRVAAVAVRRIREAFVSVGQDGRAMIVPARAERATRVLWQARDHWIEALTVHEDAGLIGLAAGKRVAVVAADGTMVCEAELAQTVSGLAFDALAKRIAASHYNGVSVIEIDTGSVGISLAWRGSHVGVSWSPCGRYIVTATQEKELHTWDLVTMGDFRIGGYPRKTHHMAWTRDGTILACSGADVITTWSFAGAGPGGRPPLEIGFVFGGIVTTVASHPSVSLVAGGFTTGNVLVGATGKGEALVAQGRTGAAISGLAWSPCGKRLAAADARGRVNLFSLPSDLGVR